MGHRLATTLFLAAAVWLAAPPASAQDTGAGAPDETPPPGFVEPVEAVEPEPQEAADESDLALAEAGPPYELPQAPGETEPLLAVEVHLGAIFPLYRDPLCPPDAECVFSGGGGVGASLERRWPSGITLGLAYDAWFLEAGGVYEVGVMHLLSARVRYILQRQTVLHPFVGVGAGPLIFGDTTRIATLGGAIEGWLGVELELTETIALTLTTPVRVFITDSFTTTRDRVVRSEQTWANVALSFNVGIAIVEAP